MNKKGYIAILLVVVILLSGFALMPLFVLAKETPFTWLNYINAYIPPLTAYLPFIVK